MPRRTDIRRIMILGSGPIVIGQAAEFDYSGAQACKVLREEGFEIVLVNSNPATIMTDPEYAEKTYVEPLLPGPVAQIIEQERPDALLPTLGGQTALNLAKALSEDGTLERFGVELIGANYDAINCAEDRDLFAQAMAKAGLKMPASLIVRGYETPPTASAAGAKIATEEIDRQIDEALTITGLPAIVRPAFTLGGRGGGIARTEEEFRQIIRGGIDASPIGQVLVDQSVIGWGEYELEVMRDNGDNVVIVCSIENIDPMGVHTGDSVTVAPQQTLTDRLYQQLRDQAIRVIRAVGVETGGSNVQFAVNPETEEILVIEMNPRVSRSSALASKATGFPIAKIAARLAVGYRLDEITNDITRATPAAFEPTIDYVVVKWPRFAFEKFPGVDETLSTHMKSVGEAMAIGRTFGQAFVKALRSRELDRTPSFGDDETAEDLVERIRRPRTERYDVLLEAIRRGATDEQLHEATGIDRWYLHELRRIALGEDPTPTDGAGGPATPGDVAGPVRTFKAVDTCAAEFAAQTPYFYSGWERPGEDGAPRHEVQRGDNASVVILGSGPNRIGQGIEFDYCCVHAAVTVKESGRDAVMINCNPETVSTDYDTSTRLYFEPLTLDDVLGVLEVERAGGGLLGVIVQFGGQTPLRLAQGLQDAGITILGTSVEAIDRAEERTAFGEVLATLGLKAPPYATAQGLDGALAAAEEVGFPLLVRPSYVLGGRAMEIVYGPEGLRSYLEREADLTIGSATHPAKPIFLDRFLENAIEVDVDALCDRETVWVGGIMQHVEEAGIHSGDSACALPPFSLSDDLIEEIRRQTRGIALELGVSGLINIQFAVHEGDVYVIEANPRASRTVPFVSKAIGVPLAKMAVRIVLGETIGQLGLPAEAGGQGSLGHVAVKEAVLPFDRFVGSDGLLGPEMRSTGEVMGVAHDFPSAFAKASAAAGSPLPDAGTVFVSVTDADKPFAIEVATRFHELGFSLLATSGTRDALVAAGVPCDVVAKLQDAGAGGPRSDDDTAVSRIAAGEVALVMNTPTGSGARTDGYEIRRAAITAGVPCLTTVSAGHAAVLAIAAARERAPSVVALQELVR